MARRLPGHRSGFDWCDANLPLAARREKLLTFVGFSDLIKCFLLMHRQQSTDSKHLRSVPFPVLRGCAVTEMCRGGVRADMTGDCSAWEQHQGRRLQCTCLRPERVPASRAVGDEARRHSSRRPLLRRWLFQACTCEMVSEEPIFSFHFYNF